MTDGHPSWLGSAARRPVYSLDFDEFGQSGDIRGLYRVHAINAEAILDA